MHFQGIEVSAKIPTLQPTSRELEHPLVEPISVPWQEVDVSLSKGSHWFVSIQHKFRPCWHHYHSRAPFSWFTHTDNHSKLFHPLDLIFHLLHQRNSNWTRDCQSKGFFAPSWSLIEYSPFNLPSPWNSLGNWSIGVLSPSTASIRTANFSALTAGRPNSYLRKFLTTYSSCSTSQSPFHNFPMNWPLTGNA